MKIFLVRVNRNDSVNYFISFSEYCFYLIIRNYFIVRFELSLDLIFYKVSWFVFLGSNEIFFGFSCGNDGSYDGECDDDLMDMVRL